MKRTAILSKCERYRYELTRSWTVKKSRGTCVYICLNPSTADAHLDDPTVKQCVGFAKLWGYRKMVIVNLFCYRATDYREMLRHDNLHGTWCMKYLRKWIKRGDLIVPAWGGHGKAHDKDLIVTDLIVELGALRKVKCFGYTMDGNPRHPLYLPRDSTLELYEFRGRMRTRKIQWDRNRGKGGITGPAVKAKE